MFSPVEEAIEEIKNGKVIIIVDDEDRENEGDFVCAAEYITPEIVNFMVTHGRGMLCVAVSGKRLDDLGLPLMVDANSALHGTQFTVTIDESQIVAMQDEAQWLINNNLTTATSVPNFLNYVYLDGLEAVNPNAVTIIH